MRWKMLPYNPHMTFRVCIVALSVGLSIWLLAGCAVATEHVYLTWQGETSRTVTVNFHTLDAAVEPIVYYDMSPRNGRADTYAQRAVGSKHQIEGLKDGRWVHHVELQGLTPNQRYYFTTDAAKNNSKEWSFVTLPEDDAPLRFVTGGDMGIWPSAEQLLEVAATFQPQFAVVGGDFAYENGDLEQVGKWDIWLERWEKHMRSPQGDLIPLIGIVGNHEVNMKPGPYEVRSPFFMGFCAQGGSPYFTRTLGANLVLFALDSGHLVRHDGPQTEWLAAQLENFKNKIWKIAVYHVPLYPSHRPFDGGLSVAGRTYWLPLFDQYKLDIAFENHDHTFKRSKPLRNNAVQADGTIYLGDGCFGVPPRTVEPERWYLEKAESRQHFWVVNVSKEKLVCEAVDVEGKVFDRVERTRQQ